MRCVGDGAIPAELGEWKAGFIEDAWVLHLIKKPLFDTVVEVWRKEDPVKEALKTYCKNEALKRYLEDLDDAVTALGTDCQVAELTVSKQ